MSGIRNSNDLFPSFSRGRNQLKSNANAFSKMEGPLRHILSLAGGVIVMGKGVFTVWPGLWTESNLLAKTQCDFAQEVSANTA